MSARRADWCDYIQGHADVLRLLSVRGDVTRIQGIVGDEARIADFISKLHDPYKDSRLLYGLMYLLRPGLRDFILGPLTRLIKTAARATKKTEIVSRAGIRGPVLWHRTLVGRISGQLQPGSFETRINERHQDIPENQLLKLFLHSTASLALQLSGEVITGASAKRLATLHERAGQLLRTNWLHDVSPQWSVTSLMGRRAARSKDNRYAETLQFQREYDGVFNRPRWQFILLLINKGWLQPVLDDDVFELYALLRILDVLRSRMGFNLTQHWGLIARNRTAIATLQRSSDSAKVQIYFDQSPVSVFGIISSYTELVDEYKNFPAHPRRPDLMIRFVCGDQERRVIVECKDTVKDTYRRDSVYKALGYLKDFSDLWAAAQDQRPKIVMVFPNDLERKHDGGNEIMLVGADDESALGKVLESAFII